MSKTRQTKAIMRLNPRIQWITSLLLLTLSLHAFADNLGVIGQTYPIEETDFLVFIEHRLDTLKQTGELKKLQKQWVSEVKKHVLRPEPVRLTVAKESHQFHYDPTFIANQDIFNLAGQQIVKKGQRVNPLTYFPLFQETLIFYNDDDRAQRSFVQHYLQKQATASSHQPIKVILVEGNIKHAAKALGGIPIYFDQAGKITTRLHIQYVPAVVTRDKTQLLICEIGEKELSHA